MLHFEKLCAGGGEEEDVCYGIPLAAAFAYESDHHALRNEYPCALKIHTRHTLATCRDLPGFDGIDRFAWCTGTRMGNEVSCLEVEESLGCRRTARLSGVRGGPGRGAHVGPVFAS